MREVGKKLKVQIRGGFSDRNDIHPINSKLQFEELDERSRVALANTLNGLYHVVFYDEYGDNKKTDFWRSILQDVYTQQIDYTRGTKYREDKMFELVNASIFEDDYSDVLSVVEYVARLLNEEVVKSFKTINIFQILNKTFEKEYIGYRFVNGYIVKISNDIEVLQIEEAASTKSNKVDEHINKALLHLSDRDNPDYENSIKESISAVEAMCNLITGKQSTLAEALKQLKKRLPIHPALEAAFVKLYAYTSDASGIRHSGQIDGSAATFDEAKFMLVACSGFVNYLQGMYSKVN